MEACNQNAKRIIPKNYMKITLEMRLELIKLVQQKNYSILQSCRKLGIKKSTAKSILRNYRRKGKIFRRKSEQREQQKMSKVEEKVETLQNFSKQIQEISIKESISPIYGQLIENEPFQMLYWQFVPYNISLFQFVWLYGNSYNYFS